MGPSREPVIIKKMILGSEAPVFQRYEDSISWIVSKGNEVEIADSVIEAQSRVAMVSTGKYRNRINMVLSQDDKDRS